MSESHEILTRLIIKKYGQEKIEGLLSEEFYIEKTRPKGKLNYIRHLKERRCLFCDGKDHIEDTPCAEDEFLTAESILMALADASNELSYSNWATDKFDRASEIVIRYAIEHNIPIDFERSSQ